MMCGASRIVFDEGDFPFKKTHARCSFDKKILHGTTYKMTQPASRSINPLSPELNPICYLLALLAHDFLHVTRIRVKPD
jgi:hypothetical protein